MGEDVQAERNIQSQIAEVRGVLRTIEQLLADLEAALASPAVEGATPSTELIANLRNAEPQLGRLLSDLYHWGHQRD